MPHTVPITFQSVPWYTVRPGDLLQIQPGVVVTVAGVTLDGAVWDVSGEPWRPMNSPRVTVLRAGSEDAQNFLELIAISGRSKTSAINVVDEIGP